MAGSGPVSSAGHDVADLAKAELADVRAMLGACTELMELMDSAPGEASADGCWPRW